MTQRSGARRTTCLLVAGVLLAGCGNAAVRAAEHGDFTNLRAEIANKHTRGELSNGAAAEIARAVAAHELSSARDEGTAIRRLGEVRACAGELDDALGSRMEKHDGAGAVAALARLEDGRMSASDAREYLADGDDRWRAVAYRGLVRPGDREKRAAGILDPSPRVRRSAIRAAAQAKDVADLDVLFETARVDPEPLLRNEALRAMSAIVREPGDAAKGRVVELVGRLRDLWTSGDEGIREDVATAWALPPLFDNGGRQALKVVIATERGSGAIAAAGVVLRTASGDAELAPTASAVVARTIREGSRRDRLHAIAIAPVNALSLDALRGAAREDDLDVRVAVLGRLLESNADRAGATRELERVAGYGVTMRHADEEERYAEFAVRARQALAAAGDVRIQAWIERDLSAPDPRRRLAAAAALSSLGRAARGAPLLADPDASVRTRAACTLLMAARH